MGCQFKIRRTVVVGVLGIWLMAGTAGPARGQNFVDVKPTPQQVEWQDLEFGVILHFGPNTFMAEYYTSSSCRTTLARAAARSGVVMIVSVAIARIPSRSIDST